MTLTSTPTRHRALRVGGELFLGRGFYWPSTERMSLDQERQVSSVAAVTPSFRRSLAALALARAAHHVPDPRSNANLTVGPNRAAWPSVLTENPYERMRGLNFAHDLGQPCATFVYVTVDVLPEPARRQPARARTGPALGREHVRSAGDGALLRHQGTVAISGEVIK
jgi:hypothetical protein